jgi:hypothetical protein
MNYSLAGGRVAAGSGGYSHGFNTNGERFSLFMDGRGQNWRIDCQKRLELKF